MDMFTAVPLPHDPLGPEIVVKVSLPNPPWLAEFGHNVLANAAGAVAKAVIVTNAKESFLMLLLVLLCVQAWLSNQGKMPVP